MLEKLESRANATDVISPNSPLFDDVSDMDRRIMLQGFRPTPRLAREPEKAPCGSKLVHKH